MATTGGRGMIARRTGMAIAAAAIGSVALAASGQAADAPGAMKITVLYGAPKDPAAFETYYLKSHMPKVYAVKGISKIELAKPLPGPDGKPPAFYRVTELWFDNPAAMQAVIARPEWTEIVNDVPNFASGGATILVSPIE